jgi:hypothetical protein
MALTKANSDVIDIPNISGGLAADGTASGIRTYIDNAVAPKANTNSPAFTGTVTVNNTPAQGDNSSKVATTAYVDAAKSAAISADQSYTLANSFGPSTKASGPKVYASTAAPSGGSDGDIWLQYV